jgi:hypothetical protein
MVAVNPLACNNFAREAAIIPLPNEDVTPPVTKIYLAIHFTLKIRMLTYKLEIKKQGGHANLQIYFGGKRTKLKLWKIFN